MPAVILTYSVKQKLQRKALRFMLVIKALVANCAVLARHSRGFIGAVIRHHKNRYKLARVVLLFYTVKQVAYYLFLVSRGYYHGIFMLLLRRRKFPREKKPDYFIGYFVEHHSRKHRAYCGIHRFKGRIPAAYSLRGVYRTA